MLSSWTVRRFRFESCNVALSLRYFIGIIVLLVYNVCLVPLVSSVVCGVEWVGPDVGEIAGDVGMLLLDHDVF